MVQNNCFTGTCSGCEAGSYDAFEVVNFSTPGAPSTPLKFCRGVMIRHNCFTGFSGSEAGSYLPGGYSAEFSIQGWRGDSGFGVK